MVHCKHSSGRSLARRGLCGPASPDASCEGEALANDRAVVPHKPVFKFSLEATDIRVGARAPMGPARTVARSLMLVALAALAILVLLPAAVAAQVAVAG